jgi:hypothetical protein
MKELDFDELDKAVNSLMSKTESSNEQTAPTNSAVQSSSASSSASMPVSVNTPSNTSVTSPTASVQPAAPTANRPVAKPSITPQSLSQSLSSPRPTVPAKRSGRFMDLVPSSYASQNATNVPRPRQGTTLTPLHDSVVADEPVVPSLPQAPSQPERELSQLTPERSDSPMITSPSANIGTMHEDMPDPLDVHAAEAENAVDTVSTSQVTATPDTTVPTPTDPVASSVDQPTSTSPFLSDAKVDKRPLGASTLGAVSSSPLVSSTPTQTTPQSLPAELHTELLEIESDNPAKLPAEEKASPAEPQVKPELTPPISIAQQYKQQPRSGDQSHAPVYDTAAHPVSHPAKKKSNILIIVVIALIILIGGGGVAALFYLGYI